VSERFGRSDRYSKVVTQFEQVGSQNEESPVIYAGECQFLENLAQGRVHLGTRQKTLGSKVLLFGRDKDDRFNRRVIPLQTDVSQTSWFSIYSSRGSLARQKARVDRLARVEPTQETKKYFDFIMAHADRCFAIVAASLFPCAMLYEYLAVRLSATRSSDKYKQWIEAYAPPRLTEYIIRLRYLIDRCEEADIREVRSVCREGFEHELSFFSGVMQLSYSHCVSQQPFQT